MIERERNYALYITIGAMLLIVALVSVWVYRNSVQINNSHQNTNPKNGYVCLVNGCSIKKKCDNTTLVIYTLQPGSSVPTEQRMPDNPECART